MGRCRPLFIYFRLFNTVDNKQANKKMLNKILSMTWVEPRTSGIESNCSTNWATTTSQSHLLFALLIHFTDWIYKFCFMIIGWVEDNLYQRTFDMNGSNRSSRGLDDTFSPLSYESVIWGQVLNISLQKIGTIQAIQFTKKKVLCNRSQEAMSHKNFIVE